MEGNNNKAYLWRAIRAKCIDCSGGSGVEADACDLKGCPLLPYRFGIPKNKVPAERMKKSKNRNK